ncbi:unnamed protein product [Allacma fusca]|uniref:Uncharacterized protein n=1 Tax=Allacma fusca TaxID=39272 RepID=A0A8J2KK15_9HEXA|nr:unnamed protein product [Allacma fusca]
MTEETELTTAIKIKQSYLAFSGHLGAFLMAAVGTYSSTALPSLRIDDDLGPQMTQYAEDWIASIIFVGIAIDNCISN